MDTAAVIVGEAVDMVRAIEPAAAIVGRLANEAEQVLAAVPGHLGQTKGRAPS